MMEPLGVNPWPAIIGACFTAESLQHELGMTQQQVANAVRDRRILRLTTSDDVDLFPAFQTRAGEVVAGLEAVLRELAKGPDSPWMWAQWLYAPVTRLGGARRRRIDELAAGNLTGIVREARNTAAAWLGDQTPDQSETYEIRFRACDDPF